MKHLESLLRRAIKAAERSAANDRACGYSTTVTVNRTETETEIIYRILDERSLDRVLLYMAGDERWYVELETGENWGKIETACSRPRLAGHACSMASEIHVYK